MRKYIGRQKILSQLNSSKEPLVVVRDSQPEAVMLPFEEYQRLSAIENQLLREKMEAILIDLSRKNKNISDSELDKDIKIAKNALRRS